MTGKKKQFVGFDHRNIIISTLKDVAAENEMEFQSRPDSDQKFGFDDWGQIHVAIGKKDGIKAHFMTQQMPGCCAILTLSYVQVDPWTRANFREVAHLVEDAAKRAGFGSLVLTQVVEKEKAPVDHAWGLLLKENYLMSEPFMNAKSGNKVVYLTKDLGHQEKMAGLEQEVWR